jgi:hypothetical protein
VKRSLVLCALSLVLGCKKPQVEVEEEGPPLPIDPRAPQAQPGQPGATVGNAPAVPGQPAGSAVGPPPDPSALTLEKACAIVDEHMAALGQDLIGRECFGLRPEGGGYRIAAYRTAMTPAPVGAWDGAPVCLWAKEDGTGYEFAYVDTGTPCRLRDDFCKLGAPGARFDRNTSACPGDDALLTTPPTALAALVGEWVASGQQGGSLVVHQDGQAELSVGDVALSGTLEFGRRGIARITDGKTSARIGYAFEVQSGGRPKRLYFGLGDVAGTSNADGFIGEPLPGRRVRRYLDGCYDVDPAAETTPKTVPCAASESATGRQVAMSVDGGEFTYTYVGTAWVSTDVLSWSWRRAAGK